MYLEAFIVNRECVWFIAVPLQEVKELEEKKREDEDETDAKKISHDLEIAKTKVQLTSSKLVRQNFIILELVTDIMSSSG